MSIGIRAENTAGVWQVVAGEGDAGRGGGEVRPRVAGDPARRR